MKLKHVINTQQFLKRGIIEKIFQLADRFKQQDEKGALPQLLKNKILASVFYEPSTRTRFSFESAMLKLGGEVITTENAEYFSSAIKGESLEDSVRVIAGYADVIILRHPEMGAAERAMAVSSIPIVNAGDGSGEHPTQALLDLYTIKKELGRSSAFKIAMIGDLLYGRTIHSLIQLLSLSKNIQIFLVSPKELQLPEKYKLFLQENKIDFYETEKLDEVLSKVDILYMTRIQKERFKSPRLYAKIKDVFVIDERSLRMLKKKAIIMHPFPRVSEISPRVDSDKRAAYFRQAKNGLYIRMALLKLILCQ